MAQASVISSKITFWNLQRKVWDEVRISSTHEVSGENMEKIKKVIATFYLTILIFFFWQLRVYISQFWGKKKSELWDKKSQ